MIKKLYILEAPDGDDEACDKFITTEQFQPLTDCRRVWEFMTEIFSPDFSGGPPAPYFEYALTSSWMDKRYLHLCRLWVEGEKIVGFVFMESPVTSVHFCLRPGYEPLAEVMVDYAAENMPDFDGEMELVFFGTQKALIAAAEKKGFSLVYDETDMVFDFAHGDIDRELPEGYDFVHPAGCDDMKLAECMWKGFNHEDKGPFADPKARIPDTPWNPQIAYNGVISSIMAPPPHSTYEHNIIIADAQGEYVCFAGMWWVEENRLAYLEPLCTVPEHRGKGLAAAALSTLCRRLRCMGAEMMTGGGDDFYRRIGYNREIHWLHYRRPAEE